MDDEALAILRELVEDDHAGSTWQGGVEYCGYCDGCEGHGMDGWTLQHNPDCPIRKGRDLLARLTEPA